jgi:hypothetical protein
LTKSDVTVRTRVYPLVSNIEDGECAQRVSYHGTNYQICSSSWESYYNVHVVSRSALEKELGGQLTEQDLKSAYLADSATSFASYRLPLYFAIEVAFLTAWLTGLVLLLRRIRTPLLVAPFVVLAGAVAWMFVLIYSPAFYDADWFYQRIALEEFIGGRGPLGLSFRAVMAIAVPLTAICLPLYLVTVFVGGVRRVSGLTAARAWMSVAGVLLAALAIQLGVERQRYIALRERAKAAFRESELALSAEALTAVKADPALAQRGAELLRSNVLAPSARDAAEAFLVGAAFVDEAQVFIPLGEGWHAFFLRNAVYRYGDVRQLKSENITQNDYDVIEPLLRTGEPSETPFWRYLGSPYLAGRDFYDADHRMTAIALMSFDNRPRSASEFRAWWQLFGELVFGA